MNFKIEIVKSNKYCYFNAVNEDGERIGKVCIDLDSDDATRYTKKFGGKFAKIVIVSTSSRYVGQGIATALLNKVIEVLRSWNLYLNVIPLTRTVNDKSKDQLIKFYSKFGFERYDEDVCTITMIRLN